MTMTFGEFWTILHGRGHGAKRFAMAQFGVGVRYVDSKWNMPVQEMDLEDRYALSAYALDLAPLGSDALPLRLRYFAAAVLADLPPYGERLR